MQYGVLTMISFKRLPNSLVLFLICLGLSACAGTPSYERAFSNDKKMDNSRVYNTDIKRMRGAVEQTLASRGFRIERAQGQHIEAIKRYKDDADADQVATITTDIGISKAGDARTRVSIVADQKTVLHKTERTYFMLLIIPIPTGKQHKVVTLDSGTIEDDAFYNDFFKAVGLRLEKTAS